MNVNRLKMLQEMLESSPNDSFLLYALAKEFEYANDDDQALTIYLKLKDSDPHYVGLFYHLGKLYERKNDVSKALEIYSEGIEISKKAKDFHALSELNTAKLNLEIE